MDSEDSLVQFMSFEDTVLHLSASKSLKEEKQIDVAEQNIMVLGKEGLLRCYFELFLAESTFSGQILPPTPIPHRTTTSEFNRESDASFASVINVAPPNFEEQTLSEPSLNQPAQEDMLDAAQINEVMNHGADKKDKVDEEDKENVVIGRKHLSELILSCLAAPAPSTLRQMPPTPTTRAATSVQAK